MKKILIVGANSAIAEAVARLWAQERCCFFLVARNAERLQILAADLKVRGAAAIECEPLDVNDLARHEAVVDKAMQVLEGIDIAFIAHGTLADQHACERDFRLALSELNTNAISALSLLTHLANRLETQQRGTLAVISSVAGDRGRASNYVYGTAKAAVSTFCEGLRARLFKSGVHVIDIRPGFVATPMTLGLPLPAMLVATPEAVARRIVAGIQRQADVLYVPAFWWLIMTLIRSIPRRLFKRMKL